MEVSDERSTSGSTTPKVVLNIDSIVAQLGTNLGANLVYQVREKPDKDDPNALSLRPSSLS